MKLNSVIKTIVFTIVSLGILSTSVVAKDKNILAYKDRGIKYYPKYVKKGLVKIGKASWYGKPFHKRLTASGERYNMYNMTAAHRTYAMNTILKVTNLANNRSVRVRINDRGPFYNSRDIDLSYGAAKRLGITQKGIGRVKIEVVSSHKKSHKHHKKNVQKKTKIMVQQKKKSHIVQIASFYDMKSAKNFKEKQKLKNLQIVEKYLASKNKTAYRVVIKCTPKEANHIIKSNEFDGAYLYGVAS